MSYAQENFEKIKTLKQEGHLDEAFELLNTEIKNNKIQYEKEPSTELLLIICNEYNTLANIYLHEKNYHEAESLLLTICEMFKTFSMEQKTPQAYNVYSKSLYKLAQNEEHLKDYIGSRKHFELSIDAAKEALNKDYIDENMYLLCNSFIALGDLLIEISEYQDAYGAYTDALVNLQKIPTDFVTDETTNLISRMYELLANISFKMVKTDEAIKWGILAVNSAKLRHDYDRTVKIYVLLGSCYLLKRDFSQAEKSFLEAFNNIADHSLDLDKERTICVNRLKLIYKKSKNKEQYRIFKKL